MRLSIIEKNKFIHHIQDLLQASSVNEMKQYIQHGTTTTFTHCLVVAYYSYWLSLHLPFKFDMRSIARGALLHDFYLYDWHIPDPTHRLHGFYHPSFALTNARRYFNINLVETDIIESHMWPLTITKIPKRKEAFLVCMIDKLCSLAETLHIPILPEDYHHIHHLIPEYSESTFK